MKVTSNPEVFDKYNTTDLDGTGLSYRIYLNLKGKDKLNCVMEYIEECHRRGLDYNFKFSENLKLIESCFDIDSEFPDLDEEVRKKIKEYFNKIQNRIGMIMSKYDEKYYKSWIFGLCEIVDGSIVL